MIDDKTPNLQLPLPHDSNLLEDDVLRLRESLRLLDVNAGLKETAILAAQQTADNARIAALAAQNAADSGSSAAISALASHNNAENAHPNMKTLPSQAGHEGKMLTTNGTAAAWGNVPKTDWDSITGKPDISVEATPNTVVKRDSGGDVIGNITGTARYA